MTLPEVEDGVEPIAIIGMAMRFPDGSHSSDQFWQMLSEGRSAHRNIPKERFDSEGYYHPDPSRAGAVSIFQIADAMHASLITDCTKR
jgi:acyl transferase domain-containing protein